MNARKEYVRQVRASFQEQDNDWAADREQPQEAAYGRTLTLRIVIGILLFLLFVLADITDYSISGCSTATITSEIEKDDYTNAQKYVMMLLADKS